MLLIFKTIQATVHTYFTVVSYSDTFYSKFNTGQVIFGHHTTKYCTKQKHSAALQVNNNYYMKNDCWDLRPYSLLMNSVQIAFVAGCSELSVRVVTQVRTDQHSAYKTQQK